MDPEDMKPMEPIELLDALITQMEDLKALIRIGEIDEKTAYDMRTHLIESITALEEAIFTFE